MLDVFQSSEYITIMLTLITAFIAYSTCDEIIRKCLMQYYSHLYRLNDHSLEKLRHTLKIKLMTTSGTIKATWEIILRIILGYTMIIFFQKITEKTNYSFKKRKAYLNYRRFVDKSTNKSSCIFTISQLELRFREKLQINVTLKF